MDLLTEKPEVKQYYLQELYKRDFVLFLQDILGYEDLNGEHLALCKFLVKASNKSKLILMPRYTFKSSIATVGVSLWELVKNPNTRILIYSDTADKAEGFLTGIKNHILGKVEKSKFRSIYSALEVNPKDDKWNLSEIVIKTRTTAMPEPNVDTGGIETSKVAKHYDIIIFDDIVSNLNVTTKEQMDKVENCYKLALSLLVPGGKVLMLGTRWHFGDLYGRIIAENEKKGIFELFIRSAEDINGKLLFDNIGEKSLTREFLDLQRAKQGSYIFSCNPYEAPILMSDFSFKFIGQVKEGDEIIGIQEGKNGKKHSLIKTKVLKSQSRIAKIVKLKLESGKTIRCTPDHNWYTARKDITHKLYAPAKVGTKLKQVVEYPFPQLPEYLKEDAYWLGGIFDGEGSCSCGSITFSQSHNINKDICNRIESSLNNLGIPFNSGIRKPSNTALGGDTTNYWINGGRNSKLKFLKWCRPVKKNDIIDNILKRSGWVIEKEDKVISIEPDGEEEVFALYTESGNYIVWGYGSKNCLYLNSPVDDETAVFKARDFKFYGDIKPDDLYITATCDPAGKGEDFTAITVVGTDCNMDLHILDIVNEHIQPSEIIDKIMVLNHKYKFQMLGMETNFFRGMLEQELRRRIDMEVRENDKFNLFGIHEFMASSKAGQNKDSRIRALQPFHERGSLKFPGEKLELLKGAFSELAFQMLQYPLAPHDDCLDSLAYHLPLIRSGGVVKKAELPVNSAAWLERQSYDKEVLKNSRLPRRYRKRIGELAFS